MPGENEYSVVVPAWNAERFVGQAIESVLAQSTPPQAVIVVDDGSADRTGDVARHFGDRVRVIRQANRGPGAATSAGVRLVATPFVAFIDADDLWLREKAEHQLARFESAPHLECIFGHVRFIREDKRDDASVARDLWGRTVMFARTGSFRRVGDVHDMPAYHGDMVDWVARARDLGIRIEMMDLVVALRRIHEGSLTYRRGGEHGYLTAAKVALDRRRARAITEPST